MDALSGRFKDQVGSQINMINVGEYMLDVITRKIQAFSMT